MSKKEKIAFLIFVAVVQIIQFSMVMGLAIINNKPLEFIFIFCSFQFNRKVFGESYHSDSLSKCTVLTLILFYFLIRGTLSLDISIFIPVLLGLYFSYLLNIVKELLNNQQVPKPFVKKRLREQLLDILGDKISEEEILELSTKNGIHPNVAETVFLYLTNSKDDVADILDIDPTTVIRRLKKFIETITNNNKIL